MDHKTPEADVEITPDMVRRLLRVQCPDKADLPIRYLGSGWDNMMFRVGDDWVVRMPRRANAIPYFRNEQNWIAHLAADLPIPVPVVVYKGEPGGDYPWPWSLTNFIPGRIAHEIEPADGEAALMAEFLRALHRPAPDNAPENTVRGVPLWTIVDDVEERIRLLEGKPDGVTGTNRSVWKAALSMPASTKTVWLHGDLHARNVLVDDARFTGVIDWGDITSGDPATDLASAWMLFENRPAREVMVAAYGADEDLIARAKGWAFAMATILLLTGLEDDLTHAEMGRNIFRRLNEDA